MMSRRFIKETLPDGIRNPVVPLSRLSTAVCEIRKHGKQEGQPAATCHVPSDGAERVRSARSIQYTDWRSEFHTAE